MVSTYFFEHIGALAWKELHLAFLVQKTVLIDCILEILKDR